MARRETRPHTILITGATDGIGLMLAREYASRGHDVLATGRQTLVRDLDFFGLPNIKYVRADQDDPIRAAHNIANTMVQLGWQQLDLAILNAGMGWTGNPAEELPSQIQQQVRVNLTGPITIAKALGPWLFPARGKLALIGSTAHKKGQGAFATYSATKAGLDGFARSLREEWRGKAEVLMIHPGPTRTAMHDKAGLHVGLSRMVFMSPKRAVRAIQTAIRRGTEKQTISRSYGWRSLLSSRKEGRL